MVMTSTILSEMTRAANKAVDKWYVLHNRPARNLYNKGVEEGYRMGYIDGVDAERAKNDSKRTL